MEKFFLTEKQLMVLVMNAQANLQKNSTCVCDKSTSCFACDTIAILKTISKQTGMPLVLSLESKKRAPKTNIEPLKTNFDPGYMRDL